MDEVKYKSLEPLTFDERALALAEWAGGLNRVIVAQRITRGELERLYVQDRIR